MAKIGLKQLVHDIKNAYLSVSKDTEPVTYGNIAEKVANMSVGGDGVMTATALTFKTVVQNIEDIMPITVTAIKLKETPYVENVGSACINTGIIPTNHRVVAKLKYMGSVSSNAAPFGCFVQGSVNSYYIGWFGSDWKFRAGTETQSSTAVNVMDVHSIDFNNENKEVLMNGVKIGNTNGTVETSNTMAIFCRFQDGAADMNCRMKLYSFKIYERETGDLVRDFVPKLSNEEGHINEACLFDNVEQKYYYSADLSYGEDYI